MIRISGSFYPFDATRRVSDAFWQANAPRRHDTAVCDAIQRLGAVDAFSAYVCHRLGDDQSPRLQPGVGGAGSAPPALEQPGPPFRTAASHSPPHRERRSAAAELVSRGMWKEEKNSGPQDWRHRRRKANACRFAPKTGRVWGVWSRRSSGPSSSIVREPGRDPDPPHCAATVWGRARSSKRRHALRHSATNGCLRHIKGSARAANQSCWSNQKRRSRSLISAFCIWAVRTYSCESPGC